MSIWGLLCKRLVRKMLSDHSQRVVVNWTKMQIERWAGGGAVGVGAKQGAVEQRLREQIGPLLESNVLQCMSLIRFTLPISFKTKTGAF